VSRSERLVKRHAALRQRQRLIVVVTHERHVCLVVHDPGEHVVGMNGHRQPLALAQGRRRFVATSGLCEQHR
jgi:hypothetical protein